MGSGQHTYVYACTCVPMYSPNPLGMCVRTHLVVLAVKRGDPTISSSITTEHLFRRGRSTYRAWWVRLCVQYHSSGGTVHVRTTRCCTPNSPLGTYRELFVTAMNRANRPHYMVQAMCTKVDIRMYVRTCCIIAHVCLHTYLCTDTCNTQYNIHTVVCHTLVHRSIA